MCGGGRGGWRLCWEQTAFWTPFWPVAVFVFERLCRFALPHPPPPHSSSPIPSLTRSLFLGALDTSSAHPFPLSLSPDASSTLSSFVGPVASFFEKTNDAAANDATASVPPAVHTALGELGAFGLSVPEEYGGLGLSSVGYARLVEVVGRHDLGLAIVLGAHQSIGVCGGGGGGVSVGGRVWTALSPLPPLPPTTTPGYKGILLHGAYRSCSHPYTPLR